MQFRTKVIGITAGLALAFSIASGSLAAPTSVTLADGAACAASITAGEINFGVWTWDGTSYVNSTAASGNLTIAVTNAVHGVNTCIVPMSVSALAGTTNPSVSIPSDNVSLEGAQTGNVYSITQNSTRTVGATLTANLNIFPSDVYVGTITVGTVTSAG